MAPYVCFIFLVKLTEWPPIGKIAAHSAYETEPSSAFEKWSGHETSKTFFTSAEGTSWGRVREGVTPSRKWGSENRRIFPDDFNALCDNFCP